MSDSIENRKTIPWLSRAMFWLGIASTLLLVYASLVPLKYTPLPWPDTFDRWHSIQWLNLGVGNRADWIANALVVIPSAFLLSGAVDYGRRSRLLLLFAAPLILATLSAVVLGIELVQVWFPPRTVSQNDIFAGWVGAAVGIGAWAIVGHWMAWALESFASLGEISARVRWIAGMFCVLGILHSVWPLDFVFSWEELAKKARNDRFSLVPNFSEFTSVGQLKGLINESIKMLCFGIWFGLRPGGRFPLAWIVFVCLLLELAQVPIFSRHVTSSQFVVGCIVGSAGWFLCISRRHWIRKLDQQWIWIFVTLVWSIALLFMFNTNSKTFLDDSELIAARWNEFFVLPLVRYYYTSEFRALSNLIGKTMVFSVNGIFVGLAASTGRKLTWGRWFWIGFVWSGCVGIAIEVLQVYLPPAIADATDIVIYVIGYSIGFHLTRLILGDYRPRFLKPLVPT